jgi:hypothetical protein
MLFCGWDFSLMFHGAQVIKEYVLLVYYVLFSDYQNGEHIAGEVGISQLSDSFCARRPDQLSRDSFFSVNCRTVKFVNEYVCLVLDS